MRGGLSLQRALMDSQNHLYVQLQYLLNFDYTVIIMISIFRILNTGYTQLLCIQTMQDSLCAGYAIHTQEYITLTLLLSYIVQKYSCHPIYLFLYVYMQAYEQGIFYPRNLFLFYGWYSDNWWVGSDSEGLSCTLEERERVVSSGLAIVNDEALSNCSKNIDTGIVRYYQYTKFTLKCNIIL